MKRTYILAATHFGDLGAPDVAGAYSTKAKGLKDAKELYDLTGADVADLRKDGECEVGERIIVLVKRTIE